MWITAPGSARVRIGEGTFLNMGVMVAARGAWSRSASTACSPTAASSRTQPPLRRPRAAGHLAGLQSKGPTRIGDNCWLGAHVVVTSGVTIGERCVIGANSVVTSDIESHSIAAGAPARVLRRIEYV